MEFKERLKSLRKENKLTQSALGNILNYGYTAISNYESGRNEPSIKDLKKIAEYFNVSIDYLLCVNDVRNPYVKNNYPEQFDELRNIYSSLTPRKRESFEFFMRWLAECDDEEDEQKTLKVAQEPTPYKIKNPNMKK